LVFLQAIRDDLEELAREVRPRAVREVAAEGERERENRVARPRHREVRGHVGLRARVGLDVGVLAAEELLRPLDGEALHLVHHLAAAVVAAAGIALGVLVGEDAAHRLEHRPRDEVFAGDQLEPLRLALGLLRDQGGDGRVDGGEGEVVRQHRIHLMFSASTSAIFCFRRSWRPPSKEEEKKASAMATPKPVPTRRSPRQRTLASLWARAARAANSLVQGTARTPRYLLATMAMPRPVPQTRTPKDRKSVA